MYLQSTTLKLAVASLLLCALPIRSASGNEPTFEAFRPAAPDQLGAPVVPGSPATTALALAYESRCNPEKRRAAIVALGWEAASGGNLLGQRVEISKFRDGFSRGHFEATRRLPLATSAVAVDAPEPGVNYYWRVLTETPEGWAASPVGRFEVPVCPWDKEDLEEPTPPGDGAEEPSKSEEGGR